MKVQHLSLSVVCPLSIHHPSVIRPSSVCCLSVLRSSSVHRPSSVCHLSFVHPSSIDRLSVVCRPSVRPVPVDMTSRNHLSTMGQFGGVSSNLAQTSTWSQGWADQILVFKGNGDSDLKKHIFGRDSKIHMLIVYIVSRDRFECDLVGGGIEARGRNFKWIFCSWTREIVCIQLIFIGLWFKSPTGDFYLLIFFFFIFPCVEADESWFRV